MSKIKLVLCLYNKVTNEAFRKFETECGSDFEIEWLDLHSFRGAIDTIDPAKLKANLKKIEPDAIMVGDIFWPTGQTICEWCKKNSAKCYFLQHGQWVYTKNKKNPDHLPYCTFVYGDNLKREIENWPYGQKSRVEAVGNPRYDNLTPERGDYIYFSPPVIVELSPSSANIHHRSSLSRLRAIRGIDKEINLMLHPHYREGAISELTSMFPAAQYVHPQAEVLPLVAKSSKVLTHRNSTVVLDGIACGKEVVLMGGPSHYPRNYFGDFARESDPATCTMMLRETPKVVQSRKMKARPFLYLDNASRQIRRIIMEPCH